MEKKLYSFDDWLLIPQYSDIKSRSEIDTSVSLNDKIKLDIPIISSPMSTVTEAFMCNAINAVGGLGIIHRYNTIKHQTKLCNFIYKDVPRAAAIGASLPVSEPSGSMVVDILNNPALLSASKVQSVEGHYYPRRLPKDGAVDWSQTMENICALCRGLTQPYPGARSFQGDVLVVFWECKPFDQLVCKSVGKIDAVFEDESFLVTCGDGRILVQKYTAVGWLPKIGQNFESVPLIETMSEIINRHNLKNPSQKLAQRILDYGKG